MLDTCGQQMRLSHAGEYAYLMFLYVTFVLWYTNWIYA